MKFGICNEIFEGWSLDETFVYCKNLGYDALEIAPFTIASRVTEIPADLRAKIRDSAEGAGIAISGLHWVLAKTEGLHLTTPDRETRRRTGDYFTALVQCCRDLGGARIVLGSPKQRDLAPGQSLEEGMANARETLEPAVALAEECNVVICLEPLGPAETNFLNTAREARLLADSFASPAVSLILDVKAMHSEQRSAPDIIRENAGAFAYFHANDPNRKGPGFGEVDFRPIAAALNETGYDGIVSVEVFDFTEGPEAIAFGSLRHLREAFSLSQDASSD